MALTEIEYGSLASSGILNQNFQYLDDRISSVSEIHATDLASINSNIVTINNSISDFNEETNSSVEEINTKLDNIGSYLKDGGLYITIYRNGASWYREYFSDAEKKERVWLEQGGSFINSTSAISFIKEFTNTQYTFNAYSYTDSLSSTLHAMTLKTDKLTTGVKVYLGQSGYSGSIIGSYMTDWLACGN